jgi:quercetin dioxygenase-like cupin family protein
MRASLILVAVVMTVIAASPGPASPRVRAQAADSAVPVACSPTDGQFGGGGQSTLPSALGEGLPEGVELTVLAAHATEQWPAFAESLVMTIRRLDLVPGAVTEIRRTQGPLLFYVESGSVALSVNGRMQPQSPGVATLVQTGQHYLLRNEAAAPATILRLALVPPDEETTVGRGEIAQVIDTGDEITASPGMVESRLLLRADVPTMSGPAHLFLACLSWRYPEDDPGETAHPGPVGYVVLEGQLLVGEAGTLNAGDCTLFPSQSPRRLRAGDPPPTLLMFGAVPSDQPLWIPADSAADSGSAGELSEFECGELAVPAEPPVAADLAPSHPSLLARL